MNAGVVEEAEQQLAHREGPGHRLRTARRARNLDLGQVAVQLHLSDATVAFLERDQYEQLPGPVFVRGYIRNYARLVGLDHEPLLQAYREALPDEEVEPALGSTVRVKQGVGSSHLAVKLVTLLLIAGLATLVVMWANTRLGPPAGLVDQAAEVEPLRGSAPEAATGQASDPDQPQATSGLAEQGVHFGGGFDAAEDLAASISSREGIPGVDDEETGSVPAAETMEEDRIEGAASPGSDLRSTDWATAETVAPAGSGPVPSADLVAPGPQVVLEFSDRCWVNIRDANGQNRILGELNAGDRKPLDGEPPFNIVLGNSDAVRILVDGKPYDFSRYLRGKVARFKLDPRGELD